MAERKIIAVAGATGAQGGGLARAILSDAGGGFAARALTRDVNSDKAKELAKLGAEVVVADVDDVESLKKAFQGARNLDVARALNPSLQTFDRWLAQNKSRIPTE